MRILPHHQDTGGFFVAVLEKVKSLPWESTLELNESTENSEIQENKGNEETSVEVPEERNEGGRKRPLNDDKKPWGPQRKRKRLSGYREDPFVFFKDDSEDVWSSIK